MGIMKFVKKTGSESLGQRIGEGIFSRKTDPQKYIHWIKKYEKGHDKTPLKYKPFISIISDEAIPPQTMDNFEVVDSIEKAKGEFVAFVEKGCTISNDAVYRITEKLNEDDYDFIYSDEDEISEGKRCNPFFKPDWSPDTFKSFFYTGGLSVFRKSIVPDMKFGYDFVREVTRKTNKIGHISRILYHRFYEYAAQKGEGFGYKGSGMVSIIIPSKDNPDMLSVCLDSIAKKTAYNNYQIIVVDNGSSKENKAKCQDIVNKYNGIYIYKKEEFNFSKMCNRGAKEAKGDFLLFLNDDVTAVRSDWLEIMLCRASAENSGAVGIKLLYPDERTIQHCGVAIFPMGPVHMLKGMDDSKEYSFGRNRLTYDCMAVSAAAMLVSREKFDSVGGFDEDLASVYYDVELCFKLREKGYYNINAAESYLIHYESASRGKDSTDKVSLERIDRQREILYTKHPKIMDLFYNINFSVKTVDFDIRY